MMKDGVGLWREFGLKKASEPKPHIYETRLLPSLSLSHHEVTKQTFPVGPTASIVSVAVR